MMEKKWKTKKNLEKTRAKKLQDQVDDLLDQKRSPSPRTKDREGREARENETSCQRDNSSSNNERGARERTFPTKKRQRRKQSKQKLTDNLAILKAEQKFGGRKNGWEIK